MNFLLHLNYEVVMFVVLAILLVFVDYLFISLLGVVRNCFCSSGLFFVLLLLDKCYFYELILFMGNLVCVLEAIVDGLCKISN